MAARHRARGDEEIAMIRNIGPSDYDGWRPLWDGYNAFYGRSGATALPEETTRATWERVLRPEEPIHARVAEEGGRIVYDREL
jgi:hypothetical protein